MTIYPEGIRKAVYFMFPTPKMCDNHVGGDKSQASTPEEYLHIRFTEVYYGQ